MTIQKRALLIFMILFAGPLVGAQSSRDYPDVAPSLFLSSDSISKGYSRQSQDQSTQSVSLSSNETNQSYNSFDAASVTSPTEPSKSYNSELASATTSSTKTNQSYNSFDAASVASSTEPPQVWITVFIHGIKSIKSHITITNFIRFMTDTCDDTLYAQTVKFMRQDPIFYENQPMQEIGLKRIDTNRIEKGYAAGAMALGFEATSRLANPGKNIENHYYTFGWSGIMSARQRYLEAVNLYQALGQEIENFRAQGIEPKIRLVAYSHGGNVALNTGLAKRNNKTRFDFNADELILLGVPIQNETDYLVNEPFFKKVYHIYSRSDHVQKLDFFSFNRFFSQRLFKRRKDFTLPNKLIQIQIKCTRTLKRQHCKKEHNYHKKAVTSGKSCYARNASPGHIEFWFFSWTPANYRKTFPLYPMPVAVFIPLILREADNFEEKERFTKPTLIDIRPQQEVIIVKNQKSNTVLNVSQFLPEQEFKKLGEQILQFKPEGLTAEKYNAHIRMAYDRAQDVKKAEKSAQKLRLRNKRKAKKERRKQAHRERAQYKECKKQAKWEQRHQAYEARLNAKKSDEILK